jgi:hypothetical protein
VRRPIVTVLVLLVAGTVVQPAAAASLRLFAPPARPVAAPVRASLPGVAGLALDRAAYDALAAGDRADVDMPLPDGRLAHLALERLDLLAPGASLTVTDARGPRPLGLAIHVFRGGVAGVPGSIAVLTLVDGQVVGTLIAGDERYSILPRPGPGGAGDHRVSDDRLATPHPTPFAGPSDATAGSGDAGRTGPGRERSAQPLYPYPSQTRLECTLAVDCDYELYADKFGSSAASCTAYMMTLYAVASAVYERDINVSIKLGFFNIWTVANDPYTATTTEDQISQFRGYWWANHTDVPRHLAHLASGRYLGGGYAYFNGVCNVNAGYAVYQLDGIYSYPSVATTWDAMVTTHETGHNFGSSHTHSCVWQDQGLAPPGALLDSCYTAEGTCYSGPTGIIPPDRGTIMSYCHVVGGINAIRLEFHSACRKVMRAYAEGTCLPAATVQPPLDPVASIVGGQVALNWNPSPTAGIVRYDVYRSLYQADPAPALAGQTTGMLITFPPGGSYYYRVRAVRAGDQSSPSPEMAAVPCAPSAAAAYAAGDTPAAVALGDFEGNGIPDLAVADAGSGGVSVLLGQRCSVCSSPFQPPMFYAAAAGARDLLVGDFNEDGFTDLAVAGHDANAVALLPGEGSGSVAYGTFGAAVLLPLGVAPNALVAGDFNEDGILDLAAACDGASPGSGAIALLLGQGADGVGDGTFAAPSLVPIAGAAATRLAAGDFNHDGILDLAAGTSGPFVQVLIGHGSGGGGDGTFAAPVAYDAGWGGAGAAGLVAADVDRDGILDLALVSTGGALAVLRGQGSGGIGDGTFVAAAGPAGLASGAGLVAGDWNQDGVPDLAVSDPVAGRVGLCFGDGAGGFAPPLAAGAGSAPGALVTGDVTDDARPDLIVANALGAGKVSVAPVSCASPYPMSVQVTSPNGGETLTYPGERTLTWTKSAGVVAVDVQLSRDGGAHWKTIARNLGGTSYVWSVTPPTTTAARVRVLDRTVGARADASDGNLAIIPVGALGVADATPGLRLLATGPNPAVGDLAVWLTLAGDAPARLTLHDVAGRAVASLTLAGLGPGAHRVVLARAGALPSGVYLIRLTQGARAVGGRVAVLR